MNTTTAPQPFVSQFPADQMECALRTARANVMCRPLASAIELSDVLTGLIEKAGECPQIDATLRARLASLADMANTLADDLVDAQATWSYRLAPAGRTLEQTAGTTEEKTAKPAVHFLSASMREKLGLTSR